MPATKTTVISVRVPPDIKAALAVAAQAERRSLATMVEVMVLDYCRSRSIPLDGPEKTTVESALPSQQKRTKSRKS